MTTTLDDLPEFKQRKVFAFMDALEAFVGAKVDYELQRRKNPEWVSASDLDRTREELQAKLVELVR